MSAVKTIFVQPDPFKGQATKVSSYVPTYNVYGDKTEGLSKADPKSANSFDYSSASRPINGIVVRPNTQAFVQVMRADGVVLKVFNQLTSAQNNVESKYGTSQYLSGAAGLGGTEPMATAWTDWLLQAVREERMEKTQIVETFGETYLYAFGEKPRTLVFSGLLMNTTDFNWRGTFWENWDKYFRATKLIENNARIYIGFDDIIVEGYPLNAVASQTADSPNAMSFSFNFFVTNYTNISAQRGYLSRGVDNLDVVRAGYARGEATLKSSRMTMLEFLGLAGFQPDMLGAKVYKSLYVEGDPVGNAYAELSGRTVGAAAKLAADVAFASPTGAVNALSFINAFAATTALDVFRTAANSTTAALEGKKNLKQGEINSWFGHLAALVSAHTPPTAPAVLESTAGTLEDALRTGAVERIIQAMGYAVGATVPGGVNSGTAYTYANTYNYTPLPPELRISANPGAISTFTTP